jgi:Tol biopolymer transport system component
MSVGGSRNIYKILLLSVIACVMQSCEDNDIDPASYEKYISISADQYPAISPDGTRVAYYHRCLEYPESVDYPTGLYVMDIDGSNRKLLAAGNNFTPSWSPDGQWLAYTAEGTIKIINLEGSVIRTFGGINNVPLFFPDWSSDGKMILMSSPLVGGGVFISDTMLESVRQLFDQASFSGYVARWNHRMDKIIYQKYSHDWHGGEICIIDTIGINDLRITNDNVDDRYPVLSNTSDMIAWSSRVRITVMKIDGTGRKTLDYGQYPSWSPGSDFVVYSNANSDFTKEVLWQINIDGSGKTQLTF